MSIHEQARAEAEKRYDSQAYDLRASFVGGFLAGHEAATRPSEPDLLDGVTDPDDLRGRVRAVMRALRNVEAERDAARGKLDKVRALADEAPDNLLDELRTLLAILDGEGSVRPVGATGDDPATRVTPT